MHDHNRTHRTWRLVVAVIAIAAIAASTRASAATANPGLLAVDIRTPFHVPAETHSSSQWCAPEHHTPFGGQLAFDIWADNNDPRDPSYPNVTGGKDVYLRLSPSTMAEGTVPDKVRAYVSRSQPACRDGIYQEGGYQQTFDIYATYAGTEVMLGSLTIAHIDNRVYPRGKWIDDPTDIRIGTAFEGGIVGTCWGGPHIHMELANEQGSSCYQGACEGFPQAGIPVWGEGSIVGKVGGSSSGTLPGVCPYFPNDENLACATWDGDLAGCDAHGLSDPDPGNDTQDCAYYVTSDKCRPRGTSNCAAGIAGDCNGRDSETFFCSTWNGVVSQCDAHGLSDPDPGNDTQDCAYYSQSHRCSPRGTSNCAAGEPCYDFLRACPDGFVCSSTGQEL